MTAPFCRNDSLSLRWDHALFPLYIPTAVTGGQSLCYRISGTLCCARCTHSLAPRVVHAADFVTPARSRCAARAGISDRLGTNGRVSVFLHRAGEKQTGS